MTLKDNELMGMYTEAVVKEVAEETEKYRRKKEKKGKATLLQIPGGYSNDTYNMSLSHLQGSQSGSDSEDGINLNDKPAIFFLSLRDGSLQGGFQS
jgi:hypothetical protein